MPNLRRDARQHPNLEASERVLAIGATIRSLKADGRSTAWIAEYLGLAETTVLNYSAYFGHAARLYHADRLEPQTSRHSSGFKP